MNVGHIDKGSEPAAAIGDDVIYLDYAQGRNPRFRLVTNHTPPRSQGDMYLNGTPTPLDVSSIFLPKEFFENGPAAFQPRVRPNHSAEQERLDYLEKKIQIKDEVLSELMAEHVALKNAWGTLTGVSRIRVIRGTRRVDFVRRWSEKTEIGAVRFIGWLNITASKFYDWERYGIDVKPLVDRLKNGHVVWARVVSNAPGFLQVFRSLL